MKKTISIQKQIIDALVSSGANSILFTHAGTLYSQFGFPPSDIDEYCELPDYDEFGFVELDCETKYCL